MTLQGIRVEHLAEAGDYESETQAVRKVSSSILGWRYQAHLQGQNRSFGAV